MARATIKVGSQTYAGKTVKAATQQALDHMANLFPEGESVLWVPIVVRAPAANGGINIGIVHKTSHGSWAYRINWHDGTDGSTHEGNDWTCERAEYACRRHLAQQAPFDQSAAVIHPADKEGARDHASWMDFQTKYARLRAEGHSDAEAHAIACGVR